MLKEERELVHLLILHGEEVEIMQISHEIMFSENTEITYSIFVDHVKKN